MPVFNTEEFVGEAMESILNQSYKDFEFIIIDDCSTDKTFEVISSYKDPRIKVIKNEVNSGRSASDNRAFKIARGEYVAKMDADDISLPNRFEKQVAFLNDNPAIDIIGGWMKHFGDNTYTKKYPASPDIAACEILFGIPVGNPTVMFRKESIEREGLHYDEDIKGTYCEDYDFFAKAFIASLSITSIGEILLRYRVLPMTNKKRQIIDLRIAGACKVRKAVLDSLGVEYSVGDLDLHNRMSLPIKLQDASEIIHASDWLTRLSVFLHDKGFDSSAIKECLSRKWYNLLYANPDFVTYNTFFKSFLGTENPLNSTVKLKFIAKRLSRIG